MLRLCDWGFFFCFCCLHEKQHSLRGPGILLPSSISGTLRLVLFIRHLSSCFISARSLFPLSSPAAQRLGPGAYLLLLQTNLISFFSSCARWLVRFFFSFSRNKIPSEPGKKILDEETIFMLTRLVSCHRRVRYNIVRVKLFFAYCLHFVMKINENKNLLITSSFTIVCILS